MAKLIGVTGGSGFIGSYVVRTLVERGHKVVIFDRSTKRVFSVSGSVNVFLGDVTDAVSVTELAAHVDGIIHLAAVLGTQETIANPRPSAEVNVLGGLNVLEACSQYKIPMVNICVGNRGMYATYSLTKSLVEDFGFMFNRYRGAAVNQVRAMNAYGPGQSVAMPFGSSKVRKITPSFICRALSGMDIEIYGDGEQVSDMVAVSDVALALVRCLEEAFAGRIFDRVVECGPPESCTVNQVAELIIRLTGSESKIVHLPMRPGETPNAVVKADTTTLGLINMNPASMVKLEDGMRETIAYYRESMHAKTGR